MTGPKRMLQIFVLSFLTLGATAAFAEEAAASKAQTPQEGISLPDVGVPAPLNRSCTASTSCATLGGSPIMCSGTSSCNWNTSWVLCDGNVTYCTCNPANITNCIDPQGFCNCWNASPTNGWGVCRQQYCWGS